VATQSLLMMNSQFILDQAARFAQRLQQEAGDNRLRKVERAWQLAFSRSPNVSELADALQFISRQVEHLKTMAEEARVETKNQKKEDEKTKPGTKLTPETQAFTDLCQILLSANEFLYED